MVGSRERYPYKKSKVLNIGFNKIKDLKIAVLFHK